LVFEQTPLEVIKMVIMVDNYGYQKSKLVLIYDHGFHKLKEQIK
jgi:hypothetical protein